MWYVSSVCSDVVFLLKTANVQQMNETPNTSAAVRGVNITRKEKDKQGMLEYKMGEETILLKNLIVGMFCPEFFFFDKSLNSYKWMGDDDVFFSDMKPRGVAVSFLPHLPAYIIFMCLRYADTVNNDRRVSTLLHSTISCIKGVIKVQCMPRTSVYEGFLNCTHSFSTVFLFHSLKRRGEDFDVMSFWLANTCRLMNCLKQYSGDGVRCLLRINNLCMTKHSQTCLCPFAHCSYSKCTTSSLMSQSKHLPSLSFIIEWTYACADYLSFYLYCRSTHHRTLLSKMSTAYPTLICQNTNMCWVTWLYRSTIGSSNAWRTPYSQW